MLKELLLITTGGTIDGADSDNNKLQSKSALYKYLADNSNIDIDIDYHAPINKDSREITELDRENIFLIISNSSIKYILIGHGTYTICETGKFLKSRFQNADKTILLVGSWIPFDELKSDATVQINNALKFLKEENKGVYIAMDGRLWNPENTSKAQTSDGMWHLLEE